MSTGINSRIDQNHEGVMKEAYAFGRRQKRYLKYRYLVRARIAIDAIKRFWMKPGRPRVLDFGTADGLTLFEMRKILGQGFFIGVEYAFELIQHARYSPDKMEIVQADVSTLPFDIKTAFFDIVVALAILEHLHHPEKVVRQAQELLSPGGLFIATSPNPVWDLISQSPKFGKREYHVNKMGTKKMIQVVKDAGLELVSFEPFMWAPLGFLPYLNIWVDPDFSLSADRFIRNLYVTNWLFVNACVVGRKSEK